MISFSEFRQKFQPLSKADKEIFIKSLNRKEALSLFNYPDLFLFDKQIIPGGFWRYYLLRCGRGFGKTYAGAAWVAKKIKAGAKVIGLCGPTYSDVAEVMVPAIIKWFPPGTCRYVGGDKHSIVFERGPHKGAIIYCYTSDKDVRGPNLEFSWCDEIVKWCDGIPAKIQDRFDTMDMAVRVGTQPQTIITSTPAPHRFFIDFQEQVNINPNTYKTTIGTMFDNPFLPQSFIDTMLRKYGNTRKGRQELYAELLVDIEGALWNHKMIEDAFVEELPKELAPRIPFELVMIVIAVDPAVTSNKNSDETGIVVVGFGNDGKSYVLADLSGTYTPDQWSKKVNDAYDNYQANYVVAEKNQGGDLVAHNLRTLNPHLPIKMIHATKGKVLRAEPIAALFEQGKVKMVGKFSKLEEQMTSYTGNKDVSPDRLDSMVYAITELMLGKTYANRTIPNIRSF